MEYYENEDDSFMDLKTEHPAIVFNDASDAAFSCEPTISPLDNNEIDFNISFHESDDVDYMVIFDEHSFSCKVISVDNLKTDSENENDKVNMPSSPSPEPTIGYIDDLNFFKDFENEFLAIAYNDLKSKSDPLNEPSVSSQHIDKFETSLSKYDEKEQNVLCLDDSFPLNVIFSNNPKTIKDNDDSVMSSSTVTYTSVYTDSEPGRVFWGADEEPSDGDPPRVINPEEDHDDYLADGGDGDDEPSDDDNDDDDDEEEEEHLALADSFAIPIVDPVPSDRDTKAFETDESARTPRLPQTKVPFAQTHLRRARKTVRLEPPMGTLGYRAAGIRIRAASPPLLLPSTSYRTDILESEMPPRKRACPYYSCSRTQDRGEFSSWCCEITGTTLETDRVMETGYGITDTWDEIVEAMLEVEPTTLKGVNQRVKELATTIRQEKEEFKTQLTTTLGRIETLEARDPEPQDEPAEAGSSCVAAVLAERDADRSRNGDDSHDSGTAGRRQASTVRECTYTDFLKCQPMNFKGTEGVVGLTQWLEKMESVFHISNCTVTCQVKFATCTLQGNVLTWWNSHVRAVRHDVAYAMPWKTLKKMMTDKYYPRGEIKKLETEMKNQKAENKRKFDDTSRNNQNQQQPFKRNNVAQAYTTGPGSFQSDCPKLKNENQGNRTRNGNVVARAYVVGSTRTNPNSNVVTGTFLLNNRYASILFDAGVDRSFVSAAFSSLIDIIPTTLDHGYDVELADGRIIWVN
ncbi:hypothetical protein Tco_0195414 [Tanacetum coccineum]